MNNRNYNIGDNVVVQTDNTVYKNSFSGTITGTAVSHRDGKITNLFLVTPHNLERGFDLVDGEDCLVGFASLIVVHADSIVDYIP